MNYQRIYDEFISDRKNKEEEIIGYFEKHHIIPKSLGGNNSKDNIIKLTAQDHFFAHALLAKIHGGPMWRAYWMMSNSKRYRKSRLMYEKAKTEQSEHAKKMAIKFNSSRKKTKEELEKISKGLKKYFKENPAPKGFKRDLTQAQRDKMSETSKRVLREKGHPMKGKKMPESGIIKLRQYMLSDKNHFKGKVMSEEQKRKIGDAQVGSLNHGYKKQVYIFNHPEHGDFTGTQNNLMHEFKLKKNGVSRLCRREYKQHKGWVIVREVESNEN